VADQPIPFWRKISDAMGFSDAELRADPAAGAAPAVAAARAAPATAPAGTTGRQSGSGVPAAAASPPVPPPATAPTTTPATPPVVQAAEAGGAEPPLRPDTETLLELWFAREDDVDIAWRQCVPGPSAAEIATRLSLVPPAFLADDVGILPLAEHILEAEYGSTDRTGAGMRARRVLSVADQVRASGSSAARRGAALVLWLWASDDLHGPLSVPLTVVSHDRALAALAFRLAAVVDPADWVRDADRRDEAARQFLFWSGHLPAGEDEATARSILAMRDSLQQNAALTQTLADHEHRLEVSRRLREAWAREAAARYSSE
jgi:hypothetical protein